MIRPFAPSPLARTGLYRRLKKAVDAVPVVDTHEHFKAESHRIGESLTPFDYFQYVNLSMIAAGGDPKEIFSLFSHVGPARSVESSWEIFRKYWRFVELTGVGQVYRVMARELWGVEEIGEASFPQLVEEAGKPVAEGWYEELLRRKANIRTCLRTVNRKWDGGETYCDNDLLLPVPCLDHLALPLSKVDVEQLESATGCAIGKLSDLEAALESEFAYYEERGMVGIKILLAYHRTLDFRPADRGAARSCLRKVLKARTSVEPEAVRSLSDYMVYRIVEGAASRNLPVQIHAGFAAGKAGDLRRREDAGRGRPYHLVRLVRDFAKTARFDVFHAGLPYAWELLYLSQACANVYPDLCGAYFDSPVTARHFLHELLEKIPINKILGFGGDYCLPEPSFAHSLVARSVITKVLAEKVQQGLCGEEKAAWIAERILETNARELFSLEDPG